MSERPLENEASSGFPPPGRGRALPLGTALDGRDENTMKITATNKGDWVYAGSVGKAERKSRVILRYSHL
jgi:hypothetical protein